MRILSLMAPMFAQTPTAPVSLGELARRAQGGDRDGLETLLKRTAPDVLKLCFHLSGARDGEDNAQRALEKIVTKLSSFDAERGSFRTWSLTVARNVCRDRGRRRGLERATFDPAGEEVLVSAAARSPGPERIAIARVQTEELSEAMSALPETMRSAIVLFHVHEYSYEEIAKSLDVPIGTVMTWLHRGRKRLRLALQDQGSLATQGATR